MFIAQIVVYRILALKAIAYRRFFSTAIIHAGEELEMVEVIENHKLMPVPWVVLESTFSSSMYFHGQITSHLNRTEKFLTSRSYFFLRPFTRITRRHTLRCQQRGIYELNAAAMTCGDIFGNGRFKQWVFEGKGTKLTVLPKMVPIEDFLPPSQSWQGDVTVQRWILPDPFVRAGSRPYQPGDTLNQVNWKASARVGALQVHQSEFTADYHLKILLNFVIAEDMWQRVSEPMRVEAGIAVAATLASEYVHRGLAVGFACNGEGETKGQSVDISPTSGLAHLDNLLLTLAGLQIQVNREFRRLLEHEIETEPERTDYLVITGYINDTLQDQMDRLRELGNSVQVIPLPSDEQAHAWLDIPTLSKEATELAE